MGMDCSIRLNGDVGWELGISVEGYQDRWLSSIEDVHELHERLDEIKDSVSVQNNTGQLRMRYV